jgi:hypothetical protein
MGMNISSSSAQNVYQASYSAVRTQRHQQFDALAQALQSGDANAANTAYAALVPSGSNIDPNSPLGKIGSALQAGNLSAAEAALPPRFQNAGSSSNTSPFALNDPTYDPDLSSTTSGSSSSVASTQSASSASAQVGHHHHHHGGGGGMSSLLASATSTNSDSATSTSNTGSSNNDVTTAAFLNARLAMSNLVTDLQNMASSSNSSATTNPTGTSSSSASAAAGASNLLNNSDFQNLESAFNSGNPTTVNTAWTQFIANTFGAANTAATSGLTASTVSTSA